MTSTIDDVPAGDPKLLKRRIAELEKELRERRAISQADVDLAVATAAGKVDAAWQDRVARLIECFQVVDQSLQMLREVVHGLNGTGSAELKADVFFED